MLIRNIHIFRTLSAVLLSLGICSCSQDELTIEHGNPLPVGKYPLMFTTSVDGMKTRAADSEPWVDGDEIAVQIDDYPVIGYYKLNTDGSVKKCDDPLSWPYESGVVKAWFPSNELPITKTITDQSKGYHNFDFLYAATEEENYKNTIDLEFRHKMAKVRCELIKGDGVTEEDLKTAKIKYFGIPNVKFSEDGIQGVGSPDTITPASDYSALLVPQDVSELPFITLDLTLTINDARIPKTLVYTPQETMNLVAGKAYTFNIKVQKDHLEVETISGAWTETLENTVPTPDIYHVYLTEDTGDLGELGFSSNVTEKSADTRAGSGRCLEVLGDYFTISYKPTVDNCHLGIVFDNKKTINTLNQVKRTYYEKMNPENTTDFDGYYEFSYKIVSQIGDPVFLKKGEHIEVGDYLFNDGKWGGIAKKIYESKELPDKDKKTPVGIVFKVGAGGEKATLDVPSNYGWNKDELEIRGYAVALIDASKSPVTWGPAAKLDTIVEYNDYTPLENCIALMKYSGYIATKIAKGKGITKYPAFQAACEFKAAGESPTDPIAGSSGWYLPSYPQLTDVRDLFKHPQRGELITNAGGGIFNVHNKRAYCTTTERYAPTIWVQSFSYSSSSDPNKDNKINNNKTGYSFVRSVLTLSKSAEK